jgi:diguanylate cyclase (GGDEF)-like protein
VTPSAQDDARARAHAPHEDPVVLRLVAHVPPWLRVGGYAATAGRVLVLFAGAVVVLGALALGADTHELLVLAGTSAAMLGLVTLSVRVSWPHRSWRTVAFPVLVLIALTVLSLTTGVATSAYGGLIPLCFVYIGLFHPGRTALVVLPVAWAAALSMGPPVDGRVLVRLAVYGITWWATAQILALTTAYQRDVYQRLRTDARTDALTSLGNRRDLDDRLARAVPGDCVVIVDLDHFKRVNDTQGHVAGDVILERFGAVLDEHLRRRDYAARYGGEEFVLILPRTEPVQALNTLRALRTEWADESTGVTFSAGIALVTDSTPPGSALAAADIALYKAKQAGRDRFRIATAALDPRRGLPGPRGGSHGPASGTPGGPGTRRDVGAER